MPADNTLKLSVGGKDWAGWQRVAVNLSMDTMPANFDVQVTEKFPLAGDMVFNPGDPCKVTIGGEPVITGYIDRYAAQIAPSAHTVRIAGRSKSSDLIDCSAFLPGDPPTFQVMGGTTLSIARQLAEPYGVEIKSIAGDGVEIRGFRINFGETPWEIIDRITRYSSLIAYDKPDGSVELAQTGTETMGSGFEQGKNVENASTNFSMDQRFSEYEVHILSTEAFRSQSGQDASKGGEAKDDGVPRLRRRYIVSEQSFEGQFLAGPRAVWECNRRKGRSQAVQITADSWRDNGGKLWAINHLATVNIPSIKLSGENWIIAGVAFVRDETGQHALVTMMPKEAFAPEPVGDLGLVLRGDLAQNNPTLPDNPPPPR